MQGNSTMMWVMIVAMLAIMYFLTIRPQRKRQKEEQTMRDNIQVGDEITTIGGIMGRVVTVKEDALIIETGADKNKLLALGSKHQQHRKREACRRERGSKIRSAERKRSTP